MSRREETLLRTQARIEKLIKGFASYLDVFEKRGLFTGPSLYFHFKSLESPLPYDDSGCARR